MPIHHGPESERERESEKRAKKRNVILAKRYIKLLRVTVFVKHARQPGHIWHRQHSLSTNTFNDGTNRPISFFELRLSVIDYHTVEHLISSYPHDTTTYHTHALTSIYLASVYTGAVGDVSDGSVTKLGIQPKSWYGV